MENQITVEVLEQVLSEDVEIKGWFDSQVDKATSKRTEKSINSFKEKELPRLIDDEINRRYPPKTPEQIALEEIQEKLRIAEIEKSELLLKSKYKDVLVSKGIPTDLVSFIAIEGNEEKSLENIEIFEGLMKTYINEKAQEEIRRRLRESEYSPPGGEQLKVKSKSNFKDIVQGRY